MAKKPKTAPARRLKKPPAAPAVKTNQATTILVLPDPHAHYLDSSADRATWAGQLAVDLKPGLVVQMGDLADMPSLFGFDVGGNKKTAEIGPTYKADCDAAKRWSEHFFAPLRAARQKPRTVALIGNHSQRIGRVLQARPELTGAIGYGDLDLSSYWDEVVDYVGGSTPGIVEPQGILFAHYFVAGSFAKPINSVHAGANITNKFHCSTVSGHTHLLSHYSTVVGGADNRRIQGLVCGWFGDETNPHVSAYCGLGSRAWWNGVCILHEADDLELVSTARLKRLYGLK
jgi:hypothetical protein